MKKYFAVLLIIIFGVEISYHSLQAQSIELLGSSTLNGAMNGVLLGGATMALQNSNDFRPVEVGLGAGILYGIGLGVYDMTQIDKGEQFYISGTFNDGTNRSILVLLDTIYGAAGGMIVGTAITLIGQEPIEKGLQYGAGTGAWLGLGFGLFDALALSERPAYLQARSNTHNHTMNSLFTYRNAQQSVEIGMINPKIINQKEISNHEIKINYKTAINFVELKVNL